jgi:serine/threonine protein kinase
MQAAGAPQLGMGRYTLRGTLGEGAQGVTYDAVRVADGKAVAIKRFDVRGARSWKDVELAEREARVLSTLDHPLVPRYVEHFEEDGALYLVMEKVEGETLDALVRRAGPLPEDEARRFLACADRALTYLHGRASPVVHRDIKPRNVVRRPDGSYVLVDFGTVSELLLRRGGASTIAGTIGYMAPEQLQGRALPATDVYAVGATALSALSGAEPETLPHRGLRVDVRAALGGRASPTMVASIEQMLEPDPDKRPASLAAILDGVRASSAPPPAPVAALAPLDLASEDTTVRSLTRLLWVLWGLGWVMVPLLFGRLLGLPELIPVVQFGSLAALIVVTWHKGALLRAGLRAVTGRRVATGSAELPRQRVAAGTSRKVRVGASDLTPADVLGQTEVESAPARRAR